MAFKIFFHPKAKAFLDKLNSENLEKKYKILDLIEKIKRV